MAFDINHQAKLIDLKFERLTLLAEEYQICIENQIEARKFKESSDTFFKPVRTANDIKNEFYILKNELNQSYSKMVMHSQGKDELIKSFEMKTQALASAVEERYKLFLQPLGSKNLTK